MQLSHGQLDLEQPGLTLDSGTVEPDRALLVQEQPGPAAPSQEDEGMPQASRDSKRPAEEEESADQLDTAAPGPTILTTLPPKRKHKMLHHLDSCHKGLSAAPTTGELPASGPNAARFNMGWPPAVESAAGETAGQPTAGEPAAGEPAVGKPAGQPTAEQRAAGETAAGASAVTGDHSAELLTSGAMAVPPLVEWTGELTAPPNSYETFSDDYGLGDGLVDSADLSPLTPAPPPSDHSGAGLAPFPPLGPPLSPVLAFKIRNYGADADAVKAAWTANWAVSLSRISPTMMMSGS